MTNGRERVTCGQFCFYGLGLSLGAKLVSTNDGPSTFSILGSIQAFSERQARKESHRILHEPVRGTLHGISVGYFAKKNEDLTCLCSTSSRI